MISGETNSIEEACRFVWGFIVPLSPFRALANAGSHPCVEMESGSPGGGLTQETQSGGISFAGEEYKTEENRSGACLSKGAPLKERRNIAGALGNRNDFHALTSRSRLHVVSPVQRPKPRAKLPVESSDLRSPSAVVFIKKAQCFANNLACRCITAGFDFSSDELIQLRSQRNIPEEEPPESSLRSITEFVSL